MKNEELILKIQALVDNELPTEEIPRLLESIEGNYILRDEYVNLLQLKHRLAQVPFPKPPRTWYADFERRSRNKIFLGIGTVGVLGAAGLTLAWGLLKAFDVEGPAADALLPWGIASLGLGSVSFLCNAFWYKMEESKGKSYKEIIR